MLIAMIDYRSEEVEFVPVIDQLVEQLWDKGSDLKLASSFDEFDLIYGSLGKYDALLLHPGIKQMPMLGKVREMYPKLPMAIITNIPDSYSGSMPVFGYSSVDKILEYFSSKKIIKN